jgi:hypothetical protein
MALKLPMSWPTSSSPTFLTRCEYCLSVSIARMATLRFDSGFDIARPNRTETRSATRMADPNTPRPIQRYSWMRA